MKAVLRRTAKEWDEFLNSILKARKEKEMIELKKPELERLILHNFKISKLKTDMINLEITEREEDWMRA